MQRDGSLARARTALDDQEALDVVADEFVLPGLDRRDDVAHLGSPRALHVGEDRVRYVGLDRVLDGGLRAERDRLVDRGAVEDILDDAQKPQLIELEAPAAGKASRILPIAGVERLGHRHPPVDHEQLAVVVPNGSSPEIVCLSGL